MIYALKNYQRDAVDELKDYMLLGLKSSREKEIVFKAPTGSGKTFMASSLFEELAEENPEVRFCVLWACPGKGELHKQSFGAVKRYLGGNPVCSLLEEDFFGSRRFIKDKEIVFINWEKLVMKDRTTGKWANNLMKDREGMNFIDVIDQTKRDGTKIVLVVDESHIGKNQKDRIQEFIHTIVVPNIVLEMSATPLNSHIDVEIDAQRVIDEGMIKQDVIVNEGVNREDKDLRQKDSEILMLELAYRKREAIVRRYREYGIRVNPLVLIQIPNVEEGDAKKEVIKDFLRDRGFTEDNGKLKLWCDDKGDFDKKAIRDNGDVTSFLVFKTAVATGWDCPRAHILVKFREGKSETFETQTIGRILRTAEAKSYGDDLLDNAYIFTNIWTFETKQDTYNPNRIKTEWAKMRDGYTKLRVQNQMHLTSFYRSRQGDYNSADSRFGAFFMKSFMSFFGLNGDDKLAMKGSLADRLEAKGLCLDLDIRDAVLEETNIGVASASEETVIDGTLVAVQMAENDIQAQYKTIIKENLSGLAYARSKSPVHSAIMDAFSTFYDVFPRSEKVHSVMKIVVNNRKIFSEILAEATRDFREMIAAESGKKGEFYEFKIEEARPYSLETHTVLSGSRKSLYQPLFVLKDNQGNPDNALEKAFLAYLEGKEEVEWYWENGTELMRINFGVAYNSGMNTFQPDFLVKFSDGTVGIFDTKPIGYRVEDTAAKANALADYVERINFNRGNNPAVVGGIVIHSGTQFYVYVAKEPYHDYAFSYQGWMNFEELLRRVEDGMRLQDRIDQFLKLKVEQS